MGRAHDGNAFSMFTVIDECASEYLVIVVGLELGSDDVLETLVSLCVQRDEMRRAMSGEGRKFCSTEIAAE